MGGGSVLFQIRLYCLSAYFFAQMNSWPWLTIPVTKHGVSVMEMSFLFQLKSAGHWAMNSHARNRGTMQAARDHAVWHQSMPTLHASTHSQTGMRQAVAVDERRYEKLLNDSTMRLLFWKPMLCWQPNQMCRTSDRESHSAIMARHELSILKFTISSWSIPAWSMAENEAL